MKVSVDKGWAVFGIGLASAAGIGLLWRLDLYVYHRLLEGFFWEAVKLEASEPIFPKFRHRMIECAGVQGVWPRVAMFYAAGVGIDLLLAAIGFVYVGPDRALWLAVLALVAGTLAAILAPWWFSDRAKKPNLCMRRRFWECADTTWLNERAVCIGDPPVIPSDLRCP
jgi:hypothetical protein